jgi:hypothetical protein
VLLARLRDAPPSCRGLTFRRELDPPLSDPDRARATGATAAMYGMRKIVIAELERAAVGEFTR